MSSTKDIEAIYPVSGLQQAMLVASRLAPGSGVYLVQLHFVLRGEVNVAALRAAWHDEVALHPVHRTSFARLDQKQPLQVVRGAAELPWQEENWSTAGPDGQRRMVEEHLTRDRAEDFRLDRAPLMRLFVARLSPTRHWVLWTRHHAISDGWSMPIVMNELMAGYRARVRGQVPAPRPAAPYQDYITWLRNQDTAAAERYWRRELSNVQFPTPIGIGGPPSGGHSGAVRIDRRELALSVADTAALVDTCRRERLTLSTYAHAAWLVLLRRYSGERSVVAAGIASGRPAALDGVETMVGCFVNTLPIRADFDDDATVGEWLRSLQIAQAEREEYGYAPPRDIRRWAGLAGDTSLAETLVVFENVPTVAGTSPGDLDVTDVHMWEQAGFPLTVTVLPAERLVMRLAYDADRFTPAQMEAMLRHYAVLLRGLAASGAARIRDLPILPDDERRRLLAAGTGPTLPAAHRHTTVDQLIAARAAIAPAATAVVDQSRQLTYTDLLVRTEALARRLRAAGVTPGSLVGVCVQRTVDLPTVLLAVWRAGAAYVPLDPAYPAARLGQIVRDAAPVLTIATTVTRPALRDFPGRLHILDGDDETPADDEPSAGIDSAGSVAPDTLALQIYTSGSTGQPKGVRVTHGNILALLAWVPTVFSPADLAGTLASTSACFDLSVFEMFSPLAYGGTVFMADNALVLPSLPYRDRVTLVNTVPSAMDTLLRLADLPPSVGVVNLAGEPLPRDLVDRVYAQPGVERVYNLYGPSEDTTYSTVSLVQRGAGKPLIGRPIAGTTAYLVDEHLNLVPHGVAGELCLSGAGVADGYHQRPDLTAERFVPDPFGPDATVLMYRTGDTVRWTDQGELEYLGRRDRQIKLRGFRIEPGEIEAALRGLPGVRAAAVTLRRESSGHDRLVAYVVGAPVDTAAWARALRETLPEHLVPTSFVPLAELPLTPNGKVDQARLPAPEPDAPTQAGTAPRTPTEVVLAGIWSEILGVADPAADVPFFDLGGDSLLLAQVFGQVSARFPGKAAITDLFRFPTIAALARHLDAAGGDTPFAGISGRLQKRAAAHQAAGR
ncbi:MAG: hypothetical protein QOC94_395 [Actinoplanes sp.]|nr:hypothetical protein [Actinoplanes sp.]